MSEMEQISNAATEVIAKILDETKRRKEQAERQRNEMNNALNDYKEKINKSLEENIETEERENENVGNQSEQKHNDQQRSLDNEQTDNRLSEREIEPLLQDEFKKIEALVNQKSLDNINVDHFKNKLEGLAKEFDKKISPKRSPIKSIKNAMGKAKHGTKAYAQDKINKFINKMNSKIKEMSNQIDRKFNDGQSSTSQKNEGAEKQKTEELTYKEKMENTLRNDPDLFKSAVTATQIKSMQNHIEESKNRLNQLETINKDDPMEQYKINDMKAKLSNHIDSMGRELNELEKSHNPEQTMDKVNKQTMENEHEKNEDRTRDEPKHEKPKQKEHVMER